MKTVGIIGASGYVGQHIARLLAGEFRVTALQRNAQAVLPSLPGVTIQQIDSNTQTFDILINTSYYTGPDRKSTYLENEREKEIITIYKVKHTSENRIYESQYSSDGKWIKTFTMINQDEIPVLVMNQLKTSYPEFTIERSMIELSNNGKMYAIELRKGKDVVLEYFLMNGKVYR